MKLSHTALFLVLFTAATAQAGEKASASAWDAAFPEEASRDERGVQGILGGLEVAYGTGFFPIAGKAARDVTIEDLERELNDRRLRTLALDNVHKAHPELSAQIEKAKRYDMVSYQGTYRSVPGADDEARKLYSSFLFNKDAKKVEELVKEEAERLVKTPHFSLANVRTVKEAEEDAFKAIRKARFKYLGELGLGALLVADGGARLTGALTGKSVGVSPAITMGRGLIKAEPKAPVAKEGAATGMSVE